MKKPLIIITGPTASGKTALSVELAKKVGGEIISADSMQVYRHMDIGSAKVTKEEMDGVRHHLIDVLDPWDEFNHRPCTTGVKSNSWLSLSVKALARSSIIWCMTLSPTSSSF